MHGVLDDEKLIAYLNGELPDDERVEIEEILDTDKSAQKALAALRREKEIEADEGGVISGFSCENCQAQYTIEFEKVRGKAFRVSCKKCGESIIIKGDAEMLSEVPPPAGSGIAERLTLSSMTMASFEMGAVDDSTAGRGAVPQSTAALSDGSLFSTDMPGATEPESDNGQEGGDAWSSFRDADSGALSGAEGTQSTADAGHSSSVLFSRSGLEHLAASAPEEQSEAGSATSYIDESSGLMDIRALGSPIYADQDAVQDDDDDIMTLGAAPTSFNPPVLTVKPKQQMNRWMKITVAACAVVILIVAVILWITAAPDEEDLATSQQIAALQQEIARLQEVRKESDQSSARKKGAKKGNRTGAKKSGQTADTVTVEQPKPAQKQPPQAAPVQRVAKAVPAAAGSAAPPPAGNKKPPAGAAGVKPAGKNAPPPAQPVAVVLPVKPTPTPPAAEPAPSAEEDSTDIPESPYATEEPKPEAKPAVAAKPESQKAVSPEQQATSEIDNLLALKAAAEPKPADPAPAAQSPAPSPPPPSGALSGAKAKLDRADVQKGMGAVAAQVKACAQGQLGRVMVKVVIGQTGRVASAVTVDTFAGTSVGVCAAKAVRKAKFPISRSTLTVKYPFNLQ